MKSKDMNAVREQNKSDVRKEISRAQTKLYLHPHLIFFCLFSFFVRGFTSRTERQVRLMMEGEGNEGMRKCMKFDLGKNAGQKKIFALEFFSRMKNLCQKKRKIDTSEQSTSKCLRK